MKSLFLTLLFCLSSVSFANSETYYVTSTYQVPSENQVKFLEALKNTETTLREEGLITDMIAIRMKSKTNPELILEIFEWKNSKSFDLAQQNPKVLAHWSELEKLWVDGGFGLQRFPEAGEYWAQYISIHLQT